MTYRERWDDWLAGLQNRYGLRRIVMLAILAIAGIASIVIKLLVRHDLDHSALLYVALPYGVAVLVTLIRPYKPADKWWNVYTGHALTAFVVFLASSAVLFEGFICVLFFMPIYFLVVLLALATHFVVVACYERGRKTRATVIPLLIALLSLEGTSEVLTLNRDNIVSASMATHKPVSELMQNLATPFELPGSDDWMLGLFPMPHTIEAGSLEVGDIHRAHTRYHRWFFTNTHEGVIELRIDSVSDERVLATYVRDTSFFSTYVNLHDMDIRFSTDEYGVTHVALSLSYQRLLDPAWYFQPMQQYAMQAMASHLISEVIIRE